MNLQDRKKQIDLRAIVTVDLGPSHLSAGHTQHWKCPFHHEQNGHSLAVWSHNYHCFGACNKGGDVIDWLMNYRRMHFEEALRFLRVDPQMRPRPAVAPRIDSDAPAEPPAREWQKQAEQVVDLAEEALWSSAAGQAAFAYLSARGLNSSTLRRARVGWIDGESGTWRRSGSLRVPCGISLPWFAQGELWAVKVRRSTGQPRYVQIAGGSSRGLYLQDAIQQQNTAIFCEGELDALLLLQEVGDLVAPLTLGSAAARLDTRWLAELTGFRTLLVAYDNDAAGQAGAERLRHFSARVRMLTLPHGKDITEFHLGGGSIRDWIQPALSCADPGEAA